MINDQWKLLFWLIVPSYANRLASWKNKAHKSCVIDTGSRTIQSGINKIVKQYPILHDEHDKISVFFIGRLL